MTFKCHKVEEKSNNSWNASKKNVLYPVHDVQFHPVAKGFVSTVGGDGMMYFWDYQQKNKIKTLNFKKEPITRA